MDVRTDGCVIKIKVYICAGNSCIDEILTYALTDSISARGAPLQSDGIDEQTFL